MAFLHSYLSCAWSAWSFICQKRQDLELQNILKSKFVFSALLRGKVTDSPSSLLFSPMPKDHQEHQQPSIITATRGASLVPFQSSSLASKENLAADAALTNGRRSRVGWAPKLRLVHVGEPVGSVTDGLKRQLNAQDSRRPNIFDPASRGAASFPSSLTVNVEDINVGVDHQDDTYLVV